MAVPALAVVGQPNKGKSSVVATLAEDEAILISPTPGTTRSAREYAFRVDDEVHFRLIDTPGFQRAAAVLAWLNEVTVSANERPDRVRAFVEAHASNPRFVDECELLQPIVDGAGIIYVVDGAKPYGAEYEIEMQILRFTGQPRMALINTIGPGRFVDDWRRAMDQYFSVVRVFDAAEASFPQRLELLHAFGTVHEGWAEDLRATVTAMTGERTRRRANAAREVADALSDMLTLSVARSVEESSSADGPRAAMLIELQNKLRQREAEARHRVEEIYWHAGAERIESEMPVMTDDLFAERTWALFGLTRRQLAATGAMSGAAVGSGVDLAVGGTSFLLGAGIGAAVGAASALFGGRMVGRKRVLGRTLGGSTATVGPIRAAAFPWVVLGRAWAHHQIVSERNHSKRDAIQIDLASADALWSRAPDALRRALARVIGRLRSRWGGPQHRAELAELISELFEPDGPADAHAPAQD